MIIIYDHNDYQREILNKLDSPYGESAREIIQEAKSYEMAERLREQWGLLVGD